MKPNPPNPKGNPMEELKKI